MAYLDYRTTELLDVAPIDAFSGMSEAFVRNFPPELMPDSIKSGALECESHWVNETGDVAQLTAGATIKPTVRARP